MGVLGVNRQGFLITLHPRLKNIELAHRVAQVVIRAVALGVDFNSPADQIDRALKVPELGVDDAQHVQGLKMACILLNNVFVSRLRLGQLALGLEGTCHVERAELGFRSALGHRYFLIQMLYCRLLSVRTTLWHSVGNSPPCAGYRERPFLIYAYPGFQFDDGPKTTGR